MRGKLKAVLNIFENADSSQSLSLREVAQRLDIPPMMLEDMIQFWVRKGKLREVSSEAAACTTCGSSKSGCGSCPFIMNMPKQYELVTDDSPELCQAGAGNEASPPVSCGCGKCH